MHRTRLAPITVALTLVLAAACGSTEHKVTPPSPSRDLARLQLAGSRTGDEAKAALYPQQQTHYVLDGTLADLGFEAPVRRLVGHEVSEAEVARIAAALGLHAAPTRTDWGYEVRDGDALLNVETDGGATWLDYSSAGNAGVDSVGGSTGSGSSEPSTGAVDVPPTPGSPDAPIGGGPDTPVTDEPAVPPAPLPTIPPPVDVPDAGTAVGIAQSLLDDLGVLDGRQWAHDVSDTSTAVAVTCASGATCPEPGAAPITQRTVTFELVVDGTRVPDVAWNVTIGSHHKVEAVSGTWARPELSGSYSLRSTSAVFDDLQHDRANGIGPVPLAANTAAEATADDKVDPGPIAPLETHIIGVSLGIARWDGTEDSRPVVYLVPTYRFHARSGDATYDIELLALDPAGFTIAGPASGGRPEGGTVGVPPGEVVSPPASAPDGAR